jgi:hypothetical protein
LLPLPFDNNPPGNLNFEDDYAKKEERETEELSTPEKPYYSSLKFSPPPLSSAGQFPPPSDYEIWS